jgi:hypothetical protein
MPTSTLINTAAPNGNTYGMQRSQVIERTIDFADLPAGVTKASADVINVLAIPAGTMVVAVGAEVISADTTGSSPTVSLGDSGSGTQYSSAGVNPKAAAGTIVVSAASAWEAYAAANLISMTINTAALTNAVLRVFAIVVDIRRSDNSRDLSVV